MKIEANQSAQLWLKQVHDYKKSLFILTECLKK